MNTKPKHRFLTKKEEERVIILCLEKLLDKTMPVAGKHRQEQWEKGWRENLESGNGVPKYFGKYKVNRYKGRFVTSKDPNYERKMLYTIVDSLGKKYFKKMEAIWEFGCGTGHNLWRMKAINKKAILIGSDWANSAVEMVRAQGFIGSKFDFFNPQRPLNSRRNKKVGVYTVAALEQTGTEYKKFVQYLLKEKPSVVVHIEPIPELLDSTKLIDYLSIQYMYKRNYLRGYLEYLESLEKKGKIKILEARRSGIGSMLIDGYSVIVWKPL